MERLIDLAPNDVFVISAIDERCDLIALRFVAEKDSAFDAFAEEEILVWRSRS